MAHSSDVLPVTISSGDALIVVDVQSDFLPGGSLAVSRGDEIIPVLNRYIELFAASALPIIATRDWHPKKHISFKEQGGSWPSHCVRNTPGAEFAKTIKIPSFALIISKATEVERDAYSGFQETEFLSQLQKLKVRRLFVGGLATDYCVFGTVKDALKKGFIVYLLCDAIMAVNVHPYDGQNAINEMTRLGALPIDLKDIAHGS